MSIDAKSVQLLKSGQLQEEKKLESMATGRLNGFVPIAPARPSAHNEPVRIEPKASHSKSSHNHKEQSLSPILLAKSLSLSAIPDKPITIRTSKKWVLPPRPKPGRKPSLLKNKKKKKERKHALNKKSSKKDPTVKKLQKQVKENETEVKQQLQEVGIEQEQIKEQKSKKQTVTVNSKKEQTKRYEVKKAPISNNKVPKQAETFGAKEPARSVSVPPKTNHEIKSVKFTPNSDPYIEIDSCLVENPIKRQILKVNEENYYLKLEVVKLMTQLRKLQSDVEAGYQPSNIAATQLIAHENFESVEVKRTMSLPLVPEQAELQQNVLAQPLVPRRRSPSAIKSAGNLRTRRQTISTATPTRRGVKRTHGNEINDLIVSLVDLTGVDQDLPSSPVTGAVDLDILDSIETKVPYMTKGGNESIGANPTMPQTFSGNEPQSMGQFINFSSKGWDTTTGQHRSTLQRSPTTFSEEDDITSTVSTTPSTMLTSTKTTDTMDSLSGTTLVSTNSHEFKLLDIPEVDSSQTNKKGKEEPSIFDDPTSLVDDSIFNNTEWNTKRAINESSVSNIDDAEQSALLDKHESTMTDNNHYEFDGLNDVEMEFENFVNGNDM